MKSDPLADLNAKRPILAPRGWSDNWKNTKRLLIVDRDGSFSERVLLTVLDARHRQELICLHFLRQIVITSGEATLGVNFWSRDDPWDFQIELSTGETFNLEITSIGDNEHQFVINGREAAISAASVEDVITLNQLVKLEANFPDEAIASLIAKLQLEGVSGIDTVDNPYRRDGVRLFLGRCEPPGDDLSDIVETALAAKAAKPHDGKSETIVLIDNRTTHFDLPDFEAATAHLGAVLANSPFPEVWIDTGYCSDDDGPNAEFTIFPLKTTASRAQALRDLAESRAVDEHGRMHF